MEMLSFPLLYVLDPYISSAPVTFSPPPGRRSFCQSLHYPQVLLGCLHLAEQVVASPPRPSDLAHSIELAKLFNQFAAVVELAR